jgi:hypothetical protein
VRIELSWGPTSRGSEPTQTGRWTDCQEADVMNGDRERAGQHRRAGERGAGERAGAGEQAEKRGSVLGLRALAHPLRWKLIDVVGTEGSATATRCAEMLAESVASCAYHLGILAKYGYVELVPGQAGREKPWRLTSYRQDLSAEGLGLEGELAAEAATDVFLDHEFARTRERLRTRTVEPPEWREPSRLLGASMWVTAEEFSELSDQLVELAQRYTQRLDEPGERLAGTRLARVFLATSVAPEPGAGDPGAARQQEG